MNSASDEPLTAELVRSATFAPARLGRRGLDEAQVHAFCDWVSEGVGRLLDDNSALQAEVIRLRERLLEGRGRPAIQPEDVHVQAVHALSRAQRTADRYVADAQEFSRELAAEGRLRRDEIVREARARASVILAEAHANAARAAGLAGDPAR
jgi:DivIVA domain-containing protein